MVTSAQLVEAFHISESLADQIVEPLNAAMEEFEITTPAQQAMFLAQCCHESGHFKRTVENLNYSADGLNRIFPKYFRNAGRDAQEYHRQPEKIANVVYASRMGNGDTASGDGWRFRGRGYIQLTGRSNYIACSEDLEIDLIENPDYLESPEGAARSAAWFWWQNDLNDFADKGDIVGNTKRVNGGTIGLEERKELWEKAYKIFS